MGTADTDRHGGIAAALEELDAATNEFVSGRPDAFKALWSQSDDATLAGGLGGDIERGWATVAARLDRVSAGYQRATFVADRVAVGQSDDLAYVVQHERITFAAPERGEDAVRRYRVTMVLRREADAWRVLHRQADLHLDDRSRGGAASNGSTR